MCVYVWGSAKGCGQVKEGGWRNYCDFFFTCLCLPVRGVVDVDVHKDLYVILLVCLCVICVCGSFTRVLVRGETAVEKLIVILIS